MPTYTTLESRNLLKHHPHLHRIAYSLAHINENDFSPSQSLHMENAAQVEQMETISHEIF